MTLECRRLTCFLFGWPIFPFAYLKRSKARRRQLLARKIEAKSKIHQLHQSCLQYEERGEEGIPLLKTSRKEAEEFLRLSDGVTKFLKHLFLQPTIIVNLDCFWNLFKSEVRLATPFLCTRDFARNSLVISRWAY